MIKRRLLLAIFFAPILAFAQLHLDQQKTLWVRYYASYRINSTWSTSVLLEDRIFMDPWRAHMALGELTLARHIGKSWKITAQFTGVDFTFPSDPDVSETYKRLEIRPQQSVSYKSGAGKWSFTNRLLVEQRFMEERDTQGEIHHGHFVFSSLRFRYRFTAIRPLAEKLSLHLSTEPMIHFGEQVNDTFDQNRLSGTLRYQLLPKIQLEGGYLHWFQRKSNPSEFYSRHCIRFGVYHKL